MATPSPLQEERFDVSHQGAPVQSGDGPGGSGIMKDLPFIVIGPTKLKNDQGQSSEAGSWSDDDWPPPEVGATNLKTSKS